MINETYDIVLVNKVKIIKEYLKYAFRVRAANGILLRKTFLNSITFILEEFGSLYDF